jgi:hypothetical protein
VTHATNGLLVGLGRRGEGEKLLLALASDESLEAWGRAQAGESLAELGRREEAVVLLLALANDESLQAGERVRVAKSLER